MIDKIHIYMYLQKASVKSTGGNKNRLFLSPFFFSISWFTILAEAFRNDHVAACSTVLRGATEENQSGGHVAFPCPSKVTQHSSTAVWLKF